MVLDIIADKLYDRIKPATKAIKAPPPITYMFNPADLDKLRAFKKTGAKDCFEFNSEPVKVNDKRRKLNCKEVEKEISTDLNEENYDKECCESEISNLSIDESENEDSSEDME
jgi:hypothetical protein